MKDYEKKYKDALERAKKELQHCGSQDCDAARQIFRLFPELKESEEDRIRKEITELIMKPTWQTEKEFNRRKELAVWLEKQGEIDKESYEIAEKEQLKEICIWIRANVREYHRSGVFHVGDFINDLKKAIKDNIR